MHKRTFSHTSMSTWRRCRQRYKWKYVDDYEDPPGQGLIRGSIGHEALGAWYSTYDENKAFQAASDRLRDYEQEQNESMDEIWELMSFILARYFSWSRANDNFEEVLAVEKTLDLDVHGHKLTGIIDGIVKMNGNYWLLEHKFWGQVSTKHLPLDPQVSIYLYMARRSGYDAVGVLYNIIRTSKGGVAEDEPVVRVPTYRNPEGMPIIQAELVSQMQEMQLFHDGSGIPIYRNTIKDCSWDCGFFAACLGLNDDGQASAVLDRMHKSNINRSTEGEEYD